MSEMVDRGLREAAFAGAVEWVDGQETSSTTAKVWLMNGRLDIRLIDQEPGYEVEVEVNADVNLGPTFYGVDASDTKQLRNAADLLGEIMDEAIGVIEDFDQAYKEALASEIQEAATLHDPN